MNLKKIIKNSLTLSMATLMSLSLCNPAIANAKSVHHNHQKITRKSYSYKQLINKAKKDSQYDFKHHTYDNTYIDIPLKWYGIHRKLWNHTSYRKAYLRNMYKLNSNRSKTLKTSLKYINKYMLMHGAYKKGYLDSSSANYINKKNARNASYAKGYIEGYNDFNGYGIYFCYQEYRNFGGKMPYSKLNFSNNHKRAYRFGSRLAKSAYLNAWTSKQIDEKYGNSKIGKKYLHDFYMGRSNYANNNNSQFAKNIRHNYKFQKTLYFPSYVYGDGFMSGVALSHYNNKAVNQTTNDLNKYVNSFYPESATSSGNTPQQKAYRAQFKKNYNIKPIYDRAHFQYGGTNKYYVHHNNVKKSGVTYMMPDGQHIGMYLSDKD